MAKDYTPNKLDLSTFHGGKQYENGQALNVEDFNKLVEGVAYAQENGGAKFYKHSIKLTSASGRLEFITPVSQKGLKDDFYDGDPTMPIKYLSVLPYFNCTISGYPCLSFWRDINEEYACFAGNSNGDVSLVFGVYLDLNDYTIEEI